LAAVVAVIAEMTAAKASMTAVIDLMPAAMIEV
jgi:hypothetical protein